MWNYIAGVAFLPVLLSGCCGISSVYRAGDVMFPDAANRDPVYRNPHRNHRSAEFPFKDATSHHTSPSARVIDLKALSKLDAIIPRLAEKRVVFIGETHTRLTDHINQLAIIRGLFERGKELAIGMEFFQQPFQAHLDDFVAGNLDDVNLLARTEYYERWRYDYRLYQPILDFARKQEIPLIALNVSSEIVRKVSEGGWDSLVKDGTLTDEERVQIPQTIDRSNTDYEKRLHGIFRQHVNMLGSSPEAMSRWRFPFTGGGEDPARGGA
uniref:Haem-binding uptake, Tiki superfamily, ChaN n=1 Tax=Candidatus Kentrum sp. LFY TaxID=2126342 RepID=A0A450U530_9GAMM|nr:MAG: Haem-binding uptake, Tiki superfamily, ChaN [Candidatus Kentron sp. LFY]